MTLNTDLQECMQVAQTQLWNPLMSALTQELSGQLKSATNRFLGTYCWRQGVRYDPMVDDTVVDNQSYAREFRMMRRKIRFPELTSWHTYTGTRKLERSAS
ncbi:hypothetical protein MJO29_015694 [Puccinia striiformis f. sp. tritici]|nr:hypothetical protein MJO29_015694 [Puccinia striiformis f. sp. tritici]